jgi:hypothetical protein
MRFITRESDVENCPCTKEYNKLCRTELFSPIARRDVLLSQLLKVSKKCSTLQDELATLQTEVLSMSVSQLTRYNEGKQTNLR